MGKSFAVTEVDWCRCWFLVPPQKSWAISTFWWPICNRLTTVSCMSCLWQLSFLQRKENKMVNMKMRHYLSCSAIVSQKHLFLWQRKQPSDPAGFVSSQLWVRQLCYFFIPSIFSLVNLEVWETWVLVNRCDLGHLAFTGKSGSQNSPISCLFV